MIQCFYLLLILFFPAVSQAHSFSGMMGFYDGISHPVLGLDHFLAMVSVGIISAQLGGRAIWTVPATFVLVMLVGGLAGIYIESQQVALHEAGFSFFIEFGIALSVVFLALAIVISKKLPVNLTMVFVGFFGLCHGLAHGIEMPMAATPALFALGFLMSTAMLHLFGVIVGHYAIKAKLSAILLRLAALSFSYFGFHSMFSLIVV